VPTFPSFCGALMVSRWKLRFIGSLVFISGFAIAIVTPNREASAQVSVSDQEIQACRTRTRAYAMEAAVGGEPSFFFDIIARVSDDICGLAQANALSPAMLQVETSLFESWRSNSQLTPDWATALAGCVPVQLGVLDCASRLAVLRYETQMPAAIRRLRPPCLTAEVVRLVAYSMREHTFILLVARGLPLGENVRGVVTNHFLGGVANLTCP